MKHFQDYKKLSSPKVFWAILLIIFVFIPVFFSNAQTADDIRNKINQRDADIAALEKEIASYQSQLDVVGKEKNSLSSTIKELDLTKKKLTTDITLTQKKIDKTNLTIQNLSSSIGTKENAIANNIDSIALGLRQTDEFDRSPIIETLLSEQDFTEVWNDVDSMETIRTKLIEDIDRLKQVKGDLEDTREVTMDAKNELLGLKTKLSDQQKIVVQNTNQKNKLLQQTKNSEANYQQLLKDRIAKKAAFEKELAEFESQLKFILDPSKLPSKGSLGWPLDNIYTTSPYGLRSMGFHYGTDFRASVGTPVKAMADGVVLGVGDTDACCPGASFGKWVFIEYNNGLSSTYGHLSLISATKGQKVSRGSIVGYSGNTGSSTGPHLHVSLYVSNGVEVSSFASKSYPGRTLTQPISAKTAYLDPMLYLPSL